MSNETHVNVKHIQKHDTEANWKLSNLKPDKGQIIIYDPDETHNYSRQKIGNGVTNVNDLPFSNVQSDWNQNDENAADYVKNRTHYQQCDQTTLIDAVGLFGMRESGDIVEIYTEFAEGTPIELSKVEQGNILRICAPEIYQGYKEGLVKQYNNLWYYVGNIHLKHPTEPDSGEDFFFGVADYDVQIILTDYSLWNEELTPGDFTTFTGYTAELLNFTLKQLDEKYIPDTIARATDIQSEVDRAKAVEADLQGQIDVIVDNPETADTIDSIKEFTTYIEQHGEIAEGFRTDIAGLQTEVGKKVDKVDGKGLSTNDFNNTYKKTLDTIKPGTGDDSIVINEGIAVGKGSIAGGTTDKSLVEGLLGLGSLLFDIEAAEAQADLSVSFGANTKAVTAGSAAIGVGNQTGVKGYYWDTIDFSTNTIKLSKTRRASSLIKPTYVTDFDWQVGDIISMVNVTNHTCTSVITAVNKSASTITVDRLPFDKIEYTTTLSVYTYTKPHDRSIYAVYQNSESDINTGSPRWAVRSGVVDIGFGGFTLGLMNLTSGNAGFNAGYNNWVAGGFGASFGRDNLAGYAAVAEGWGTKAIGDTAHTENFQTEARGFHAHAQGYRTKASSETQDVAGKFNIEDTEGKFAHILGNGTAENNRSNAHTVDWDGNAWYAGEITVGEDKKVLATEEALYREVNPAIATKVADIDSVLDGLVYENKTAKASANTLNIPADAKGIGRLSKVGGHTYVKDDTNTFVHSDVTKIRAANKSGGFTDYALSDELINACPDYGMGLNNEYYNYLDLESGKYYHRVTVLPKTDFGVLPANWHTNYNNLVSVKDSQLKLKYDGDKLITSYYHPSHQPDPDHGYDGIYQNYLSPTLECEITIDEYDNDGKYFGLVTRYNNEAEFIIFAVRINGAGWIEGKTSTGWESFATFNLDSYGIKLEKGKSYIFKAVHKDNSYDTTENIEFYINNILVASVANRPTTTHYDCMGGYGIATKGVDISVKDFDFTAGIYGAHTAFDDIQSPSNGVYIEALDDNGVESYMVVGNGKSDLDEPINIIDLRKYIDINDFVINPLEDVSNIRLVYKSGYITANELPCELKYMINKEIIQEADDILDDKSTNPIQNSVVTTKLSEVNYQVSELEKNTANFKEKTEKRLKTVEAVINNGKLYEDKTATIDTLPYTVTEDVLPYAAVTKVGGLTSVGRKYNLIKFPYDFTEKTLGGVTCTANTDGSLTLNGACTDFEYFSLGAVPFPDTFCALYGCPEQDNTNAILRLENVWHGDRSPETFDVAPGTVYRSDLNGELHEGLRELYVYIVVYENDVYNNVTFYPQYVLFDEFNATLPKYEPATKPSNKVNKVIAESQMILPSELIEACPDFGTGINSDYYNYIDLEEGMYYRNVCSVPKESYLGLAPQWTSILNAQYATAKSCDGYVALTETSGSSFNHLFYTANEQLNGSRVKDVDVSVQLRIGDYLTTGNYFGVIPFYTDDSHFLIVATRINGSGWIEFMTPSGWVTLCNFNLSDFGITLEKDETYTYRVVILYNNSGSAKAISFSINGQTIISNLDIPEQYYDYLYGYKGITSKGVNVDLCYISASDCDGASIQPVPISNPYYTEPEGAFLDLGNDYLIPATGNEQTVNDISEYTHYIDNIIEIKQGGTITTEPDTQAVIELKYQVKM